MKIAASPGITLTGLQEAVDALLTRLTAGGYLAVLAYLPEDEELLTPLRAACDAVSLARDVPVTLELGPRYLHSTGQLHKGGPAGGAFLVVTTTEAVDMPIPEQPFTLAELHAAQPAGDIAALADRERPVLAVELPGTANIADVVAALACAVEA